MQVKLGSEQELLKLFKPVSAGQHEGRLYPYVAKKLAGKTIELESAEREVFFAMVGAADMSHTVYIGKLSNMLREHYNA